MRDTISSQRTVLLKAGNISADTYSNYIDLQGFQAVEIRVTAEMDTADADNYITPVLKVASATPASTASYSTAATTDVVGTAFAAMNDTTTYEQTIGYIGPYRYICVMLDETSTAAGEIHVTATVRRAENKPVSSDPTTGTVT